ncbi:Histone H2B type 2-E [Sciurus carolinensis]|uniref:Histone H2B type 2-E n=1 Tax=Sciurus carolinensis TaxID=30640 RepID=A0AA41N7Y4_SCICA|nr:Histone H2B type 2-E [Sciurus carolinensis]
MPEPAKSSSNSKKGSRKEVTKVQNNCKKCKHSCKKSYSVCVRHAKTDVPQQGYLFQSHGCHELFRNNIFQCIEGKASHLVDYNKCPIIT